MVPQSDMSLKESDRFYKVNIHERRVAAYVCRAFPLTFVVLVTVLSLYGAYTWGALLLFMSAFFNVALWIWVVSTALISIHAALFKLKDLECCPIPGKTANIGALDLIDNHVIHLIVIANYSEDENMLAQTLRSLSEAEGSKAFWIVLAMEAREGDEGRQKGKRLQVRFSHQFARFVVFDHPANLVQSHQDGSEDAEVPGKSSNLKYAVEQSYKECMDIGVHLDSVVLTVADADCIFHPFYFSQVGKDFLARRIMGDHQYSMWQAPQFPYRNFWTAPIVSRVWGYVSSTYEFGGVAGTARGGHQMAFSSFSLPLLLAHGAEAWDGDIIADDHHSWLKCFYFSIYQAGQRNPQKHGSKITKGRMKEPPLVQIRPVFLPMKSTLLETKEYWKAWVERWGQAKRHAQGVAELSYAMLATYDALRLCILPKGMLSWHLSIRMFQAVARLFCMHVLPICQTICLGILSVKWFVWNRNIAMCPDKLWFMGNPSNLWSQERYMLCGLAGAWVLIWPVVVPWALIVISNFLVMQKVFLGPAESNQYASIWHAEDGNVPRKGARCKMLGLIVFDCVFGMSWILVPYGFLVELLAYVRIIFFGNRSSFVSSSKPVARDPFTKVPSIDFTKVPSTDYGAVRKSTETASTPAFHHLSSESADVLHYDISTARY